MDSISEGLRIWNAQNASKIVDLKKLCGCIVAKIYILKDTMT